VNARDLVLVVEDDPASLGLLHETLERAGFTVLLARDGERALEILERITPNAVLMDALLPGRSGFEITRTLRRCNRLADTPVLFMTGLSETEHVVEALESGGVDYVVKPINATELVARLRVHLSNARRARDSRTALDVSGQYVVSVDDGARVRWSTPHALGLLFPDAAGASRLTVHGSDSLRLPAATIDWLRGRGAGGELPLSVAGLPMRLLYVGRTSDGEHLLRVLRGEAPDAHRCLIEAFKLTGREAETLLWVVAGKANKEVALILDISPRTVNKHLDSVYVKLGVENRTAAAVVALRRINGH